MIPENLPEYVDRGGRQVWRPPYLARDTEVYGFVLACDRSAIDALLRRDLVEPAQGAVDYRSASGYIAVLFAEIGRLSSGDPRDGTRGYVSEREVSVWCLAADMASRGRLVWYLPYVFVDSGQAAASGREVYGYPKQMAEFEDDFPGTLARPGTTTVQAQAIATFGPNAKAVPLPMVEARRRRGRARIGEGPDAFQGIVDYLAKDLEVDTTLPFGAAPQPSAAITPVDEPPPAPPPAPPLWAARRILDTVTGRTLGGDPDQLLLDMVANPVLVFLKQFRDVECPTKACYQAIVEAPLSVVPDPLTTRFHLLEPSLYSIKLADWASHPIASEVGVDADTWLTPELAFSASFGFDIELGEEVWRAPT